MLTYDYRSLTKRLKKIGYSLLRQGKWSHEIRTNWKEYGEISVPNHWPKSLTKWLIKAIINHTWLSNEDFDKL